MLQCTQLKWLFNNYVKFLLSVAFPKAAIGDIDYMVN
jgi:hypothetical protein